MDVHWVVALKPRILCQHGTVGILYSFLNGGLLIMGLARIGLAQINHFALSFVSQEHVLVGVGLLLPTVMRPLFFRVFRVLPAAFGAVDQQQQPSLRLGVVVVHGRRITQRRITQSSEGALQYRGQTLEPLVGLRLTQPKALTEHGLEWIRLVVGPDKQQLFST